MKRIILAVIAIIIIVGCIKFFAGPEDLHYSNATGSFTFDEDNISGRDHKLCIRNFEAYKQETRTDTVLLRISPKNYLKVWLWPDYFLKEKYRLPYRSWNTIETLRGTVDHKSRWQSF